ncbi:cytochrome P450, partial [Polychytrium aggregatum]|uniref:cytochrome P450 n=1 Tax=Polychytrium aggregatum TaxID=110093 RepID=UPI0022FDEE20
MLTIGTIAEDAMSFAQSHSTQLAIAASVLVVSGIYLVREPPGTQRNQIPGPKGWPIVGEFFTVSKHISEQTLHMFYYNLVEQHGPVTQASIMGLRDISVSEVDEFKEILKGGDQCAFARPPRFHNTHRSSPLPPSINWNSPMSILRKLGTSSRVNLHLVANAAVLDILGYVIYSKDLGMTRRLDDKAALEEAFKPYSHIVELIVKRFMYPEWLWDVMGIGVKACEADVKFVKDIARDTLRERRSSSILHEHQDLLDRLTSMGLEGDAKFTEEEILDEIYGFFLAGHETTANMITFILVELMKNRHVYERVQKEIDTILGPDGEPSYDQLSQFTYLDMAVKETQRLHPPAPLIPQSNKKRD